MKLIFENWKYYLNERATDKTYIEIINFLVDSYTDSKNYEYASKEEEEIENEKFKKMAAMFDELDWGELGIEKADVTSPEDEKPKLVQYELSFNDLRAQELYGKMIERIPEAVTIFPDGEDFYYTFYLLKLKLYYVDSDGNPEAETYEEIRGVKLGGYYNAEDGNEVIAINLGSTFFKPPMPYEEFINLDNQKIFSMLKRNKGVLKMIIEHEFTHMLNHSYSGHKKKRAKGLKRQHRQKNPEVQSKTRYINSTEEIQARLIPIFNVVSRAIRGEAIEDNPVNEVAKLISLEVINKGSINNIIKLLYKMYDLEHEKFLDWTSKKNKKRISKRFYEFAKEITGV
jgi:hypothetical protein